MQRRADPFAKGAAKSREVPKAHRLAPRTFQQCLAAAPTREAALLVAYRDARWLSAAFCVGVLRVAASSRQGHRQAQPERRLQTPSLRLLKSAFVSRSVATGRL
jgi:hypothetical protein